MLDPTTLEELSKKLTDLLPSGIQEFKQDIDKNIKAVLISTFDKLDLVTREELDIQKRVLEKTRAKVKDLQEKVSKLEAEILGDKQ